MIKKPLHKLLMLQMIIKNEDFGDSDDNDDRENYNDSSGDINEQ